MQRQVGETKDELVNLVESYAVIQLELWQGYDQRGLFRVLEIVIVIESVTYVLVGVVLSCEHNGLLIDHRPLYPLLNVLKDLAEVVLWLVNLV